MTDALAFFNCKFIAIWIVFYDTTVSFWVTMPNIVQIFNTKLFLRPSKQSLFSTSTSNKLDKKNFLLQCPKLFDYEIQLVSLRRTVVQNRKKLAKSQKMKVKIFGKVQWNYSHGAVLKSSAKQEKAISFNFFSVLCQSLTCHWKRNHDFHLRNNQCMKVPKTSFKAGFIFISP